MTDRARERPPGAVDFDAELSVLADSAVFYHRNRGAAAAGMTPEELVGKACARTAAIADEAEQRAKARHATACRKGCAWCRHQNVRASAAEVFYPAGCPAAVCSASPRRLANGPWSLLTSTGSSRCIDPGSRAGRLTVGGGENDDPSR